MKKPTAGNVDSGLESFPWSAVGHVDSVQSAQSSESKAVQSGSRSSRNKKREVAVSPEKPVHRFTPNGTRIPDGPPPKNGDDSPMPPVPPFPLGLDANGDMEPHACTSYVSDLYGTCESKKKGEQDERCDAGVPSASEAKQLWLEREVSSSTSFATI